LGRISQDEDADYLVLSQFSSVKMFKISRSGILQGTILAFVQRIPEDMNAEYFKVLYQYSPKWR
jgi:hypothetical protein